MKTVLISGGTGFLGTHLIAYLHGYFQVHLITRDVRNATSLYPEIADRILSYQENVDSLKFDYFIHLAGKAHDLKNVSNPEDYYATNTDLTKWFFKLFLKLDAEKFIFLSTVKAVTDACNTILDEAHPCNPQTHYGRSKRLAEEHIVETNRPMNKQIFILRPCMIHGPGNKGNLNLLYNFVNKGIPYPLASFLNKRSFLSVENLCFVIKEVLDREDIPSGVYNVADDEPLSTNEVISLLAEAQNRSPRLLNAPRGLISFLAKLGDKLRLPLTTERLQKLTENYVVSNAKIKNALGKELPLSSREGILRTARAFKTS